MPRCQVDKTIKRVEIDGVAFPLGVYPVEKLVPRVGYTLTFEPADGDGENEVDSSWEEWPDRYLFDIMLSATRVEALCRSLFAMLPGRVFPILDVLGHDEYREVDPYVSYELVGQERFHDAMRRYRDFFYEDGLVGFGAMSEEPFIYVFVDEHKIITVRAQADLKDRIERLLSAFDLTEVEEIAGADAATHEHRGVLDAPEERLDLLNADEIVEELRNDWGLVLNVDPEKNIDEEGEDLGMTAWRCLARHEMPIPDGAQPGVAPKTESAGKLKSMGPPVRGSDAGQRTSPASSQGASGSPPHKNPPKSKTPDPDSSSQNSAGATTPIIRQAKYAEVILTADSLAAAEKLLWEAMQTLTGKSPDDAETESVTVIVALDRIQPETFAEILTLVPKGKRKTALRPDYSTAKVWQVRWLE